jgi:hypothetical protein
MGTHRSPLQFSGKEERIFQAVMPLQGCNRLIIHRCPHSATSAVDNPLTCGAPGQSDLRFSRYSMTSIYPWHGAPSFLILNILKEEKDEMCMEYEEASVHVKLFLQVFTAFHIYSKLIKKMA